MIKEIFEIEPIQKNSLIMFLGVFCLCFLQIFIFKRKVLEEDAFISIGLTLGLSVCWVVVQLPGFYTFFINTQIGIENKKEEDLMYERIALGFGLMLLFWMTLITYVGYELQLSFKNFIRFAILIMTIKFLIWFVVYVVRNIQYEKKVKKKTVG